MWLAQRFTTKCAVVIVMGLPALLSAEQQGPPRQEELRVELRAGMMPSADIELAPEAIAAMELGLGFRAITGRPFRAEMVVESERRLADGNVIQRKKTSVFCSNSGGA